MLRILVVYASDHGQTAKIVERMASRWLEAGHGVTVRRADQPTAIPSLGDFDVALVAGSVRFGKHQRSVRRYATTHRRALERMPAAFVSVCGALVGDWAEGPATARGYLARFVEETGWRPRIVRSFAGAVRYTAYGPLTRWMMKQVSRKTGRPTDTSRDWEGTDWTRVDRLAEEVVAMGESRKEAELSPA
ncbi:MAG: flavodoxin domain-containing protein [Gemmatimonadales bacterium]